MTLWQIHEFHKKLNYNINFISGEAPRLTRELSEIQADACNEKNRNNDFNVKRGKKNTEQNISTLHIPNQNVCIYI